MSSSAILLLIGLYFGVLLLISFFSSRRSDNQTFFIGNRRSPWYLVAIAMVGTSISGVTFISVPGWVGTSQFSYLQVVLGYLLGYFVVANVLLPLYYKLQLTSIYSYLEERFGFYSYKTGASLFLLSRVIGAAFRLFIVSSVLQLTVFSSWGVPFSVTVSLTVLLIWLYTRKGGVRTVLWTDAFQTVAMLTAVGLTLFFIADELQLDFSGVVSAVRHSEFSRIWFFDDINSRYHFAKQFLSGAFITIVMTGLDQDMMQKNLSCKTFAESRKNMYWYGFAFLPINLLFLSLGVLLYSYAGAKGIALPEHTDDLFPMIATQHLSPVVGTFFILGLIAAAYSSADSALTALTTSFTIDILGISGKSELQVRRTRQWVHLFISALLVVVILLFHSMNDRSVIDAIFTVAGYTYGPLLGLYAFGMFTRFKVNDRRVPFVAIAAPILCYFISRYSEVLLNGYQFGYELLVLNGLLTFVGLLLVRTRANRV